VVLGRNPHKWKQYKSIIEVPAEGTSLPPRQRARILVVDTDRQVRLFLGESLRRFGYRVWQAASGELAMKILREDRVDLIIGDAAGLEPDGEKTLLKLRRSHPGMKILAMTGTFPAVSTHPPFVRLRSRFPALDPAALKARLFLGVDATLPKPVSVNLLIETIQDVLGEGT